MSFDLDIDNYSNNNLRDFFKLKKDYNDTDLEKQYQTITETLLLSKSSDEIGVDDKKQIYQFINQAKQRLLQNYQNSYNVTLFNERKAEEKAPNFNPYSSPPYSVAPHFAQDIYSKKKDYPNQINYDTATSLYVFNTIYSDNFLQNTLGVSNLYTFTLPEPIRDVVEINLSASQYPNIQPTFSPITGNNLFFISVDNTDISGTIMIPSGTYNTTQFPPLLQQVINTTLYGSYDPSGSYVFSVSIDPYTNNTIITNNLNQNFTLIFNRLEWAVDYSGQCPNPPPNFNTSDVVEYFQKNALLPRTAGFQMGFRQILLQGQSSYTSTSTYDSQLIDYYYFALNDYQINRRDNVNAVFQSSVFNNNILAIIPITSAPFTSTLDTGANFIYKSRKYFGPVNISKIEVALYNLNGQIINLYSNPFAFVLECKIQVKNPATIQNNTI
jgi:hypothetical protein